LEVHLSEKIPNFFRETGFSHPPGSVSVPPDGKIKN